MKILIFIVLACQVLAQLIPKKDGQLAGALLAKRDKKKTNKKANKKSNKKDKNKEKQTFNPYAISPPKIPFAPEPLYFPLKLHIKTTCKWVLNGIYRLICIYIHTFEHISCVIYKRNKNINI